MTGVSGATCRLYAAVRPEHGGGGTLRIQGHPYFMAPCRGTKRGTSPLGNGDVPPSSSPCNSRGSRDTAVPLVPPLSLYFVPLRGGGFHLPLVAYAAKGASQ
jgi:hypothetical protein